MGIIKNPDDWARRMLSYQLLLIFTIITDHLQPFLEYRFSMVTPFVNKYVPLLPAVSLHAGVLIPIASTPQPSA
ncbi:MAG: hypothetical protein IPL46_10645 [Saprospiraceae bacterium]|nr:hypothetical protein [Saprospiraceae bacterium]